MSMSAGPRPASGDRAPLSRRTGRRLMYWRKPRRAQMDRPLGLAPPGRVGHDADERARREVEPRARPQGAEDGLGGEVDELAHRGIVVRRPIRLLHVIVAQQLAADLTAPSVGLALGHGVSLL